MEITKIKIPSIERVPAKIHIPYHYGDLTFSSPGIGPKGYREAAKTILARGQALPNGDEMISLLHTLYCTDLKNESEAMYINDLMNHKRWIWIFNSNLAVKDGIYVTSDPRGVGLTQIPSRKKLDALLKSPEIIENVLFSKDRTVRFAPKETYSQGIRKTKDCHKDGFLLASLGPEGSIKYEEILTVRKNAETSIRGGSHNNNGKPRHSVTAIGFYGFGFLGISTHRERNAEISNDAFGMLK